MQDLTNKYGDIREICNQPNDDKPINELMSAYLLFVPHLAYESLSMCVAKKH